MRAILVDDEPIMLGSFLRSSAGIEDLTVIGSFEYPEDALEFAETHSFEVAFLDVEMPEMSGIELAQRLRAMKPHLCVVFISAYEKYIRESNRLGADDYIVKPYTDETLELMMKRLRLLCRRQEKELFIRTFGVFGILRQGQPLAISGKAKEILALLVTKRGREISNEEIYSTVWEGREYDNVQMKVYYNALRRLKATLEELGLSGLLRSTAHGQLVNTELFDCDYYDWLDRNTTDRSRFQGEFLPEYSWGEYILADMLDMRGQL